MPTAASRLEPKTVVAYNGHEVPRSHLILCQSLVMPTTLTGLATGSGVSLIVLGSVSGDIFDQVGVSPVVAEELRGAAMAARAGDRGSAMTHAWLFTGPPGSGRSVAALAFAAALECTDPQTVGCGRCEHCRKVMAKAHGDVVYLSPRELTIKVDTVRQEVVLPAAKKPTVARWRIVIIDDADRFTENAANALLKTLEEPPAHTVIMMCAPSTDPEDVIPTLVSRSRHVYVPQPRVEDVVKILTRDGSISEAHARLAAQATGSHVGRARRLATGPQTQSRRAAILNLPELIFHGSEGFLAAGDIVKAATTSAKDDLAAENEEELAKLKNSLGVGARGKGSHKALSGSKSRIDELENQQKKRVTRAVRDVLDMSLQDLAGIYRDALLLAFGSELAPVHPDMAGLAQNLAKMGPQPLLGCIDAVSLCREAIAQGVRPEAAMDAMVGRLRIACNAS